MASGEETPRSFASLTMGSPLGALVKPESLHPPPTTHAFAGRELRPSSLYLFRAPAGVRIPVSSVRAVPQSGRCDEQERNEPHVGRRLDARNVLQHHVADADERDDRARGVLPPVVAHDDTAHEEVDWRSALSRHSLFNHFVQCDRYSQTPRPMKLNMNEAYRVT